MTKYLVLTDLHLVEPGETIIGLDPGARFSAALWHALERHPDAEKVILLGDLTHHGRAEQYERLKGILADCPIPVTMTIGNHDDRTAFSRAFGTGALNRDGFAQFAWREGDTLFAVLDTNDHEGQAPRHGGWLCETRLQWLRDQIATEAPRRIVAMMHHPPFPTGFAGMDRIRLMNGTDVLAILQDSCADVHLICGHVHRTISGTASGMGFSMLKSPCHQMPMALDDPSSALSIDEPGAYGIVLLRPGTVIVHSEDVLEPGEAMPDPSST